MNKVKIIIVNDSRSMRLFLEEGIKHYHDCFIVGSFFDAQIALEQLAQIKPDVILLDLEMPKMDGLTFLERLPNDSKFPTIILSNYANDNSKLLADAFSLGALDSMAPPSSNSPEDFKKFFDHLHHKILKTSLKSSRFNHGIPV